MKFIPIILTITITVIALSGCNSDWASYPNENQHTTSHDPLSYGMVTSTVEKGVTTQVEIVENFGPPNITSKNKDGEEVWIYDRISNESSNQGWADVRRFNVFFGLGSGGSGNYKHGSRSASSTRTLTVIVTFNSDTTVKNYSSRATQF